MAGRWIERRADVAIVERGEAVSVGRLAARASALAAHVRERAAARGPLALSFRSDRAAFAAALFAAWSEDREVWLADPGRRETVAGPAFHPRTALYVHDSAAGRGLPVRGWSEESARDSALAAAGAVTAISTEPWSTASARAAPPPEGLARVHATRFEGDALAEEVSGLAHALGAPPPGPWLSVLPPSHGPAALAAVLLPLECGAPFASETPSIDEVVCGAACAREPSSGVLVAGPGHLAALACAPRGVLGGVRWLLASGDRFDGGLARHVAARHGVLVHGVFGASAATPAESAVVCDLVAREGSRDAAAVEVGGVVYALVVIERRIDGERVRTAARIPRNPGGVLDRALLLAHFGLRADGSPLRLDVDRDPGGALARIPADTDWTEGHFEGHPLFAGGAQLAELVLPALRDALGAPPRIVAAPSLKFLTPIRAGDELSVFVDVAPDRRAASFRIERGATTCASGRLELEGGAP